MATPTTPVHPQGTQAVERYSGVEAAVRERYEKAARQPAIIPLE